MKYKTWDLPKFFFFIYLYITGQVWGSSWDNDVANLRVFMATLRKKIETDQQKDMIQTHIGVGYRMIKVE